MTLSPRLYGAALVVAATVCWSSGGILVRLVEADGWVIVFWRALFMALTIAGYLAVRHRRGAVGAVRTMGWAGVLSGLLLAGCFVFYILSLTRTEVANTVVLMSASPLVAALLGRLLLREPLSGRTLAAIATAFAGIAYMVAGGLGQGSLSGNLFALGVALCFGANIVVVRTQPQVDMVPASLVGGLFAALFALPAVVPAALAVAPADLLVLAAMGVGQLGMGLFLFLTGVRYLKAAEAGLLGLLETVLTPIWVWIGIGEVPPTNALVGGGIVLLAVAAHAVMSARERAEPMASAAVPVMVPDPAGVDQA